jgi:hypothetical protein
MIGVIFFIGSIVLMFTNYNTLKVERNGKIVKMKIEQLPKTCIGSKTRYFVTYSYEGSFMKRRQEEIFVKSIVLENW